MWFLLKTEIKTSLTQLKLKRIKNRTRRNPTKNYWHFSGVIMFVTKWENLRPPHLLTQSACELSSSSNLSTKIHDFYRWRYRSKKRCRKEDDSKCDVNSAGFKLQRKSVSSSVRAGSLFTWKLRGALNQRVCGWFEPAGGWRTFLQRYFMQKVARRKEDRDNALHGWKLLTWAHVSHIWKCLKTSNWKKFSF